jgi:hypothetical protein
MGEFFYACQQEIWYNIQVSYAGVAESADALDSGSSGGNPVEVQVLLSASKRLQQLLEPFFFDLNNR